ncbi:unnamed protein product [Brassica rapa subsp. trilocularis]
MIQAAIRGSWMVSERMASLELTDGLRRRSSFPLFLIEVSRFVFAFFGSYYFPYYNKSRADGSFVILMVLAVCTGRLFQFRF